MFVFPNCLHDDRLQCKIPEYSVRDLVITLSAYHIKMNKRRSKQLNISRKIVINNDYEYSLFGLIARGVHAGLRATNNKSKQLIRILEYCTKPFD